MQERVGKFLAGLSSRKDEVRRRCCTILQSKGNHVVVSQRPNRLGSIPAPAEHCHGVAGSPVRHTQVAKSRLNRKGDYGWFLSG